MLKSTDFIVNVKTGFLGKHAQLLLAPSTLVKITDFVRSQMMVIHASVLQVILEPIAKISRAQEIHATMDFVTLLMMGLNALVMMAFPGKIVKSPLAQQILVKTMETAQFRTLRLVAIVQTDFLGKLARLPRVLVILVKTMESA